MKSVLIPFGLIILTISCSSPEKNLFWNDGIEIFDVTRFNLAWLTSGRDWKEFVETGKRNRAEGELATE